MNKNFIGFITLLRREIVRVLRIWVQSIVPPIITTILYFIIFGNLIGSRIGYIKDVSYIEYIAPGLIMLSIIINSYSNVASSFFGSKFQKNLEEIIISPMSINAIMWGFLLGGVFRGIFSGIIVCIISLYFIDISIHNILAMLSVAILTSIIFSLAGLINGLFANKFDDIAIVPTFVITPLTYLGGIFYSIDLLPEFWKKITYLNPIFYIINAFRYCMLGISDLSLGLAFIIIITCTVLLYLISWSLLYKGSGIRH